MDKQILKVSRNFKSRTEAQAHLDDNLESLLTQHPDTYFVVHMADAYLWEYAVYAIASGEMIVPKDAYDESAMIPDDADFVSEVDSHIETFSCDRCGGITDTLCAKCYCCPLHCDCNRGDEQGGGLPELPPSDPPAGGDGCALSMSWLNPMATYAAQRAGQFWYYPTADDFRVDSDYVVAVDDDWIIVSRLNRPRLIHVSQLDEPISRRNDPDWRFENDQLDREMFGW